MSEPRKLGRVLIVDDEYVIASTLTLVLRHEGFEALFYTDPIEALRFAHVNPPDLLISDVVMPLLSGIELALQVQECCPDCRILLFSGHAATANLLGKAPAKARRFELLSKPMHPTDLLKEIDKAMQSAPPRCPVSRSPLVMASKKQLA